MNLIKRNSTFDFPLFMDDFLKPDWFGGQHQAANNLPSVNIEDLETEFRIDFAVPGMKREDFAIEIDNNELSISSKANSENETKTENYTRREFNFHSFKRVFTQIEIIINGPQHFLKSFYSGTILNLVKK